MTKNKLTNLDTTLLSPKSDVDVKFGIDYTSSST
jgi:hypothetical protein